MGFVLSVKFSVGMSGFSHRFPRQIGKSLHYPDIACRRLPHISLEKSGFIRSDKFFSGPFEWYVTCSLFFAGRTGEESENEVDRCKLTQTQLLAVNLLAEQSKRSCLQRRRSSPPKLELAEKYLSAAPIATIQISAPGRKLKVELVRC